MINVDYLVVGAGITGVVIARQLVDAGREVLVLDKRPVVGGNCYDEVDGGSGIRYNVYGPHYFRTSSGEIWKYAQRFSEFRKFEAVIKSCVDGNLYDYPPTLTMDALNTITDPFPEHRNFEETMLGKMSYQTYEKFVKGYTEKQWGKRAVDMDASLANRVELRRGSDRRLSTKKYQGVPVDGYTQWISSMLSGIDVRLGVDYLGNKEEYIAKKQLVFTGAIDAFFGYQLGRLEYRSQSRLHSYFPEFDWILPTCQVNYPHPNIKIIREIEWKHIWPTNAKGTLITQETPIRGGEEYPVPSIENKTLIKRYREMADSLDGVIICGRLGTGKYMDMDEALASGLMISERILND